MITPEISSLEVDEYERALEEFVNSAEERGEPRLDLVQVTLALEELDTWKFHAALWRLWSQGRIQLWWDRENNEMNMRSIETHE